MPSVVLYALNFMGVVFQFLGLSTLLVSSFLQKKSNVTGSLGFFRYNQARNISRDLEKQASKVLAEAEEAGNKALQIYANLTSLPTVDSTGLEVCAGSITCSFLKINEDKRYSSGLGC